MNYFGRWNMLTFPDFELGLWNAWIFLVPSVLTFPIFFHLAKVKGVQRPSEVSLSKPKMVFCLFSKFIYFIALAYSFFLPLKFGNIWFYIGLPIAIIGLVASWIVLLNWAQTRACNPVTRGLYRFSRHPMYVTHSLLLLGVSIVAISWIFLFFTMISVLGAAAFIELEEQGCLEVYGDEYREYMKRTPRWLGMPVSKSSRLSTKELE
ncbi:methyltransferase family protein [[Eubacterium] cellulosolvens]